MVPADALDESCDKVSYRKDDLLTAGACLLTMRERHDLGIVKEAAGHWTFHTPQLLGQGVDISRHVIYNDFIQ